MGGMDWVGKDEKNFETVWGMVRWSWEVVSYPWASW